MERKKSYFLDLCIAKVHMNELQDLIKFTFSVKVQEKERERHYLLMLRRKSEHAETTVVIKILSW